MEEDNIYLENQDRYFKGLRDQYNESNKYDNMEHHQQVIKMATSALLYSIRKQENLKNYTERLQIHVETLQQINHKTHVEAPKGCWHTHTRPDCFMCKDREMYTYLLNLFKVIAEQLPNYIPRPL